MNRLTRRIAPLLCCAAILAPAVLAAPQDAVVIPASAPAVEGNRRPTEICLAPDGRTAFVSEEAEGTVAVIDARSFAVVRRLSTGGSRPAGLALSRDGGRLVVANSYSASVAVIHLGSGIARQVRLPGQPAGIALHPDGRRAFVTLAQLDEVAEIDLQELKPLRRTAVGRRPWAIALTADGETLAVANQAGGSLSLLSTVSLRETARVPLKGVNVRGIALTADDAEAYLTLMPAQNRRVTADAREVWHNVVQAVTLEGAGSAPAEDQWTDFARFPNSTDVFGSPDQHGIAVDPQGRHAWVAVGGRDVLTRITIHDRRRNAIWPFSQVETLVGANPRGVAYAPATRHVWVTNALGNSLTVVDGDSMQVLQTIPLGPATRADPAIRGQYLFNNARLTRIHRFTCNSCHPEGASDGLTWRFAHVQDGLTVRNSRDLRSGVTGTAPFRWTGVDAVLETFLEDEVTGLLRGPKPGPEQLRDLTLALESFVAPPNPNRAPDGSLTPEAAAGERLFQGKAGCASCHSGDRLGGSGRKADVGTSGGLALDVPHLLNVHDGAPYLHDGRAATLEEVFERHDAGGRHGRFGELTPVERKALLRYVREL